MLSFLNNRNFGPEGEVDLNSSRQIKQIVLLSTLWAFSSVVSAGPPFETDDPFPLPLHTGEFYLFTAGSKTIDGTVLDAAPAIEANFSFMKSTFLHLIAPLSLNHTSGEKSAYGMGDLELGFKWRFLEQSDRRPETGIFPILVLPTGDEDRGLGSQKAQLFLPVWLGKETESWTTYGGGGYWINPGDGNQNWWFAGWLVQRQINDRIFLGAEVYHQTPDADGASAGTGVSLGGGITIEEPYQVLFSVGRDLQDPDQNRFSFYLSLYRTF